MEVEVGRRMGGCGGGGLVEMGGGRLVEVEVEMETEGGCEKGGGLGDRDSR